MPEFNSISELTKLLDANCRIEKVEPPVYAYDAEVNIVRVTVTCPDCESSRNQSVKEEASALMEFIRTHK